MTGNVKISVVVPVYNASDLLPRAVGSILMQEFHDYEVILVNDGSTDASAQVCEELAEHDMRIRVIDKENGGVSSARNAGIEAARGEYVMFVDADDAIRDRTFDKMYDKDSDFVLAGFEKVAGTSVREKYRPQKNCIYTGVGQISTFFDRILPRKNTYILNSACFKLFRRSVLIEKDIRFVEGLSFAEDKLFVMSFLEHVTRIRTVPFVAYSYFLRDSSLSSDMVSDSHATQIFTLMESYAPLLNRLEERYPDSRRISDLYHSDLVGRYVCRILGIFATRSSDLRTVTNISLLYDYMKNDGDLGIFSLRLGQVPNLLLFRMGKPDITVRFYKFTSSVASLFMRRRRGQKK